LLLKLVFFSLSGPGVDLSKYLSLIFVFFMFWILACQSQRPVLNEPELNSRSSITPSNDLLLPDLKTALCDLMNEGANKIEAGEPDAGLFRLDEAVLLVNTYRPVLSFEPGNDDYFKATLEEMDDIALEVTSDLPGEEEEFEGQDSIAEELADQEFDAGLAEDVGGGQDHFFFDAWEMGNPKTAAFLHDFTSRNAKSISASLNRAAKYLPMIQAVFEEECLPQELCYLPLIESGYKTTVRSRARAVGMWQFVEGTAKMMGLKVDWWVDERRDPEASTRAAARYLNFLYKEYGDWYLTLVAYNAGPGRVNRAIRKGHSRNFWRLAQKKVLPRESRNYIPAFMAAVTIAKDPEAFGFNAIQVRDTENYDIVDVDFSIELKRLAKNLGLGPAKLLELNPALRHGVTPGGKPPYHLRIPVGMREKTSIALNDIPVNERVQWKQYRIRRGDTLGGIARKFGVSIYALKTVNGVVNPRRLRIGQRLTIPFGPEEKVIRMAYGGRSGNYRIRSGDTLSGIAQRMHTSVVAIRRLNPGLNPRRLRPGKSIRVSGRRSGATSQRSSNQDGMYWVIRRGDTLYDISRSCGTSVKKLCAINGIKSSHTLQPGKRLKLPAHTAQKTHKYAIKKGDTLGKIAKKFKVKLSDLIAWNHLGRRHILQIGQEVIVYR
jgi:membrane-bound lytic murein transglycosylase D